MNNFFLFLAVFAFSEGCIFTSSYFLLSPVNSYVRYQCVTTHMTQTSKALWVSGKSRGLKVSRWVPGKGAEVEALTMSVALSGASL